MSNRFMELAFELSEVKRKKMHKAMSATPISSSVGTTVKGGSIMDPFYRDTSEKGGGGGRSKHLGIDISLPKGGDGSYKDPRRGEPVYAAIKVVLPGSVLNSVRVYDKAKDKNQTGVGLSITGDAELVQAIVKPQPWAPKDDDSYGGIVGVACHYQYKNSSGSNDFFTIYVEYLHLITDTYLPKNKSGVVASASEWAATGKSSGFGPAIKANAKWAKADLQGISLPHVGYLGATQTPHVHVQAAFSPGKVEYARDMRLDPLAVIY